MSVTLNVSFSGMTSHDSFFIGPAGICLCRYFRDKDALIQETVETVMEATWKAGKRLLRSQTG